MMETIFIVGMVVMCTLIMGTSAVMVSNVFANIAIAKAEIAESGKTRRERINIRADMVFDGMDGDDSEPEGEPSELDALARMLGYHDAGSAMTDPSILAKLGLGKKSVEPAGVPAGTEV